MTEYENKELLKSHLQFIRTLISLIFDAKTMNSNKQLL